MARIYEEVVDRFHMCKTFTSAKADTMLSLLNHIDDKYVKLMLMSIILSFIHVQIVGNIPFVCIFPMLHTLLLCDNVKEIKSP